MAADLAHPIGDLVVTSLSLASKGSVGDLGELLGTLAQAAKDEARMRLRVDAARARLRTAVRVIATCAAATGLGHILLNRRYLDVYRTVTGQLVLALVALCWGVSLQWLSRMGRFVASGRFLAADTVTVHVRVLQRLTILGLFGGRTRRPTPTASAPSLSKSEVALLLLLPPATGLAS